MIIKTLVTGSSGYLGKAVFERLQQIPYIKPFGTTRHQTSSYSPNNLIFLPDIGENSDFTQITKGIDVIIHTAARVHLMQDDAADPLAEYRKINRDGTLNLARQASANGVKRFIFISSIKVNGERTKENHLFTADDIAAPEDAYAISKYEAEQALLTLAKDTNMQLVIIRPPLIYGYGVKGNFAKLINWIERRISLPLGAIYNKRSFIALDNLVDLIVNCIDHPVAANQIFLASDGEDLSTTELLRRLAKAAGVPSRLLPIPEAILNITLSILGKKGMAQRLLSSLQIDISKTQKLLNWKPPISVDEGLRRCFISKE